MHDRKCECVCSKVLIKKRGGGTEGNLTADQSAVDRSEYVVYTHTQTHIHLKS